MWRLSIRFKHKINKRDKALLKTPDEKLTDRELEQKMALEDKLDDLREAQLVKDEEEQARDAEAVPLPEHDKEGG